VITQGNQTNNNWASIKEFDVMGYPASTNATLSNLALSVGNLSLVFASGTSAY